MTYSVEYDGFCIQGLVRKNNEDNIWCKDRCLPIVHTDETRDLSGSFFTDENGVFAVFDGMGGEECGEMASYIAAKSFGELCEETLREKRYDENEICRDINRKVLDFADRSRLRSTGSTVVGLLFEKKGIRGFNLGDSRCYLYSKDKMKTLSKDHVLLSAKSGKNLLTQCIGVPESEFLIEPKVFTADYEDGDIYLLCSDGVNAVVGDKKLEEILSRRASAAEKAAKIKEAILKKGAPDNATALVFEVKACSGTKRLLWYIKNAFSD